MHQDHCYSLTIQLVSRGQGQILQMGKVVTSLGLALKVVTLRETIAAHLPCRRLIIINLVNRLSITVLC